MMPELTDAQQSALRAIVETWGPALSGALSEAAGRLVTVEVPTVEQLEGAALSEPAQDTEAVLQASWAFPALGDDEVRAFLSAADALQLAASISADELETELTDNVLTTLAPVLQHVAEGLGLALCSNMGRPDDEIHPLNVQASVVPQSSAGATKTAGLAVAVRVPYRVENGPSGTLTFSFTPAMAAEVAAGAAGGAADSHDPPIAQLPNSPTPQLPNSAGFFGGPLGGGPLAGMGAPASPFQAFDPIGSVPDGLSRSMDLIMDIPLDVSVELGRVQMLIKDVLELATGSIVELERVAGEPVDLLVNGQLIAKGEVVVIEDNFGIRITEIVSPADRLHGMGKRAA